MKPRILISGGKSGCPNYIRAVEDAGGKAAAVYAQVPDAFGYDGLVLCGGGDVADRFTGAVNPAPMEVDPGRDQAELTLIQAFLRAGRPILGICRGHQVLNLALGGTLILDLSPMGRTVHTREQGQDKCHPVRSNEGSLAWRLYGPTCVVNSAHHQAVDRLASGLTATQWSEDGVVEAFESSTLPVWGFQWHPERLYGDNGTADGGQVFRAFLSRCEGR